MNKMLERLFEKYNCIEQEFTQKIEDEKHRLKGVERKIREVEIGNKSPGLVLIIEKNNILETLRALEEEKFDMVSKLSLLIETEYNNILHENEYCTVKLINELYKIKRMYLLKICELYDLKDSICNTYYRINNQISLKIKKPSLIENFAAYKGMDKSFRIFESEILKAYHHGCVHDKIRNS